MIQNFHKSLNHANTLNTVPRAGVGVNVTIKHLCKHRFYKPDIPVVI